MAIINYITTLTVLAVNVVADVVVGWLAVMNYGANPLLLLVVWQCCCSAAVGCGDGVGCPSAAVVVGVAVVVAVAECGGGGVLRC